jgi:tripartite-type tricarboxylate transporter receptor subunit TctC
MKVSSYILAGVLAISCAVGVASTASAQTEWPMQKPVTLIWPFGAGGDLAGRAIADALTEKLGQQFIIDNRPGASGTTGTALVARAEPDGYTLAFAFPGPAANNANTFSSLPYDPLNDFTHIMQVTAGNMMMVSRTDFGPNGVAELVEYAKANPGQVTVGSLGQGTYGQLVSLALQDKEGLEFTFVPYTGTGDMLTDHLSQSLDISANAVSATYIPLIKEGKLKALGISSEERMASLPDVPTFKEQGIDLVVRNWIGLMGPAAMSPELTEKIHAAFYDVLTNDKALQDKLAEAGQPALATDPVAFRQLVVDELAMWKPIIDKYNIRVE